MNAYANATPVRATARFAIASEPAAPDEKSTLPHLQAKPPRWSSSISRMKPLALALAVAVGTSVAADRAAGHTPTRPDGSTLWVVDNCNDAGAGSLRDAAAHANHGDGIDLGSLACSTISVSSGAITLHDVELTGPGAAQLDIDGTGNQGHRIFNHAGGGGTLHISGVTISGGTYVSNASLGGGCLRSVGGSLTIHDSVFRACAVVTPVGQNGNARGGAIAFYGSGDVHLYGTTITSNLARTAHNIAEGGGIYAQGSVDMYASTITNNSVSASGSGANISSQGGGLWTSGAVWIEDSTLDGNTASRDAGAAFAGNGGVLLRSTVSNNFASAGTPGVVILGGANASSGIYSSTISGNVAEQSAQWLSGGLYLDTPTTTITNSTITGNSETNQLPRQFGAGIVFGQHAVAVSMSGTIVAGNYFDDGEPPFALDDIDGPESLTILGDTNMVGWAHRPVPADTLFVFSPELGPLQNNGGPTRTHMPLPNSPVIDHGDAHGFSSDQRGLARVVGPAADIGAVEFSDVIFAAGFE
ncbi:MAG: choice-of-anchor Q domain-containing protein [Dokdonella sp.]